MTGRQVEEKEVTVGNQHEDVPWGKKEVSRRETPFTQ